MYTFLCKRGSIQVRIKLLVGYFIGEKMHIYVLVLSIGKTLFISYAKKIEFFCLLNSFTYFCFYE